MNNNFIYSIIYLFYTTRIDLAFATCGLCFIYLQCNQDFEINKVAAFLLALKTIAAASLQLFLTTDPESI